MGWVVSGVQVRINDGEWIACSRVWIESDQRSSRKWLIGAEANLSRELGSTVAVIVRDDRGEMASEGRVCDVSWNGTGWESEIVGGKALKPVEVSDAKR